MNTKRNGTTTPTPLWAYGLVLALGVTTIGMVRLAQAANRWGPGVGDIVSFSGPRPTLAPEVKLTAIRREPDERGVCRLDSRVMSRSHGSLVVESALPDRRHGYFVHWAGGPTSAGAGDCGTQAQLILSGSALGALATAAGGFGVQHRSMLPSLDD